MSGPLGDISWQTGDGEPSGSVMVIGIKALEFISSIFPMRIYDS